MYSEESLSWSRRRFVSRTAFSGAALALAGHLPLQAETPATPRFKIIGFSKPFQTLSFDDTADLVAEVGWAGIECPVRPKGQIIPEHAEDELPKLVEALRKRKLELSIIATDIRSVTQPYTEKILRVAAKIGIRHYRLGETHYRADVSISQQLDEIKARLRDLAALNKELGLCAGWQNHSGSDYMGAPVWDIYGVIKDFDPRYISNFFDIAHATIEGGLSWPVQARLMQPFLGAVFVKDFTWQRSAKGWREEWCPLGEGMVHREFFQTLGKSSFTGLINQHHEYKLGEGKTMVTALRKDLRTLQEWLVPQSTGKP